MIVVDSCVWIDFFNNKSTPHTNWLAVNLGAEIVAVPDLVLCEVLQGVRTDSAFRSIRAKMSALAPLRCSGIKLAVDAAQNYRFLRERAITIRSTIDCLVATLCIQENHAVLHHDRDYKYFAQHLGLQIVQV